MVETFVLSLVLAALSGLTFVAYKHPRGYRKMSKPLALSVSLLAIAVLSFTLGGTLAAIGTLKDHLDVFPDQTLKSEEYCINGLYDDRNLALVVLVVTAATLGYLYFLSCLPRILEYQTDGTDPTETGDSDQGTKSKTPLG
jgi:hypothetical protein